MGSRVMHYIVAKRVAQQINFDNSDQFILGGIAPDASLPKDASHYYQGDHDQFTRQIAYESFYKQYRAHGHDDYILGYYVHLVTDDLWLKGFYTPWLKNRLEADELTYERYHHDFYLLNAKLLTYYEMTEDDLTRLTEAITHVPDLKEVQTNQLKNLLKDLANDMKITRSQLIAPLQVFTLEQIIGYIETSVKKCLFLIQDKRTMDGGYHGA